MELVQKWILTPKTSTISSFSVQSATDYLFELLNLLLVVVYLNFKVCIQKIGDWLPMSAIFYSKLRSPSGVPKMPRLFCVNKGYYSIRVISLVIYCWLLKNYNQTSKKIMWYMQSKLILLGKLLTKLSLLVCSNSVLTCS